MTLFLSIFQGLIFLGSIPILYWACEVRLHISSAIKSVFMYGFFGDVLCSCSRIEFSRDLLLKVSSSNDCDKGF
jgi:hypothetical protein